MADRRSGNGRFRFTGVLVTLLVTVLMASSLAFGPTSAEAAPGPQQAPEWWFDAWSVPSLWAAGADGRGVTVAVIDTGVQASIPELTGRVVPGADFIGNGTDGRTDFDSEAFSHGTAMASLIVAREGYGNIAGLAPGAKVLPIAVPLKGVVRLGTPVPDATSQAIRYAADHGAKVISMSLGGFVYQGEDPVPCPTPLQDAVLYALKKGSLVVAASGNSGEDGSPVEEPGVCLGVVSVGAVDANRNVASFSSRHPYLTVSAPGDTIATLSKVDGQAFIGGGTSQATAIASAALALVWSKYPHATNKQILSRLLSAAVDRGPKGKDNLYGLGVIDPNAAIKDDAAANQPNIVFTGVQPLVALAASAAQDTPTKLAAGDDAAPLGSFAVGTVGSAVSPSTYALLAAAALLALLSLVLLVKAFRRRARPRTAILG
jgi:subtilisin family serine protease